MPAQAGKSHKAACRGGRMTHGRKNIKAVSCDPLLVSLQIRKQQPFYCQKMNVRVHLCRMIECELYKKCKQNNNRNEVK
jgi:hypothetical protein